MKLSKIENLIEYKVPTFVCTKCNLSKIFNPKVQYFISGSSNNLETKNIGKCACGNEEFVYSGYVSILKTN
ncbi:hypothetical protein [uncultured Cetobacterium sp.]|uniref:hypothetical protein n=1 Tax=uncultured Cetobacterium sp. TaxID=527638 RepID=UPI00262C85EC|nr:hypothetical protein [uncultured Cetobacterium sp.]